MGRKNLPKKKKESQIEPKLMLVIRIRGKVHINYKIEDTLKMLRLHKVNHAVVLYADKTVHGMLKKIKDYVAYGEIQEDLLLTLLKKRTFLEGNKPLTEIHLKNKTNFPDMKKLSTALMEGKIKLKDIYKIKPIFRLHPPRGGFRGSIKKSYNSGGVLGFVGKNINTVAKKMV